MTLNEFLAKAGSLIGLAEKNIPAVEGLQAEVATLLSKVQLLTDERDQLGVKLQSAVDTSAKTALMAGELQQQVAGLTARAEKAETELAAAQVILTDPNSEIEKRASARLLEISAAQGIRPVNPAEGKPGAVNVRGRDRLAAAIKAELDTKFPLPTTK